VVVANGQTVSRGVIEIAAASPALFTADGSGEGPPPAVLTTRIDGFSRTDGTALCGSGSEVCSSLPIALGAGENYLALFGTGIRGNSSLSEVSATIGGETVPVIYAGPQGEFAGLDQVNLGPVPAALAGRGEVEIVITVGSARSNPVTLTIQ
jgi:uncharacterized protein (TIGR03437 family)